MPEKDFTWPRSALAFAAGYLLYGFLSAMSFSALAAEGEGRVYSALALLSSHVLAAFAAGFGMAVLVPSREVRHGFALGAIIASAGFLGFLWAGAISVSAALGYVLAVPAALLGSYLAGLIRVYWFAD